jgi:hypothetical protein
MGHSTSNMQNWRFLQRSKFQTSYPCCVKFYHNFRQLTSFGEGLVILQQQQKKNFAHKLGNIFREQINELTFLFIKSQG